MGKRCPKYFPMKPATLNTGLLILGAVCLFYTLIIVFFKFTSSDEAVKQTDKGIAYYQQGQYSKAITEFKKDIASVPNDAVAHQNLGQSYYQQGKYELAVESYQKAIGIDPNYISAHNNLGLAYLKQSKYRLAIKSFSNGKASSIRRLLQP